MSSYAPILIQLLLLAASLYLFFSLRARVHAAGSSQMAHEIAELHSALSEMLNELQDMASRTNEQLMNKSAQASELIQTIDERMKAIKELSGRGDEPGHQPSPWTGSSQPAVHLYSRYSSRHPALRMSNGQESSLDLARHSKIGRGEVELMLNLERYERSEVTGT